MSGFDYNDGDGGSLSAVKSSADEIVVLIAYDEKDGGGASCTINIPKNRGADLARWLLRQCAVAEVAAPKRWDIYATEMWGSACLDVEERPDGMWVRWDDIASQYMNNCEGQKP